jgi:hypothetical protein
MGLSQEIVKAKKHLASLQQQAAKVDHDGNIGSDLIWGGENIAREIGLTVSRFYYLFGVGAFRGAVWKLSHKTMCASRQKLRELPALVASETSKSD